MFAKTSLVSTIATLTTLSTIVVGMPATTTTTTSPNSNTFVGIATHSGNDDVHLQAINANGSLFYLSRDSSSYCPTGVNGLDCANFQGNDTVFVYGPEYQMLDLSTSLPGGQQVYVKADGSLSYTSPHSGFMTPGSSVSPFQYEPQTDNAAGKLRFQDQDFYACPPADGNDGFQIYAAAIKENTDGSCIGVGFTTFNATGTSYQY